MMSYVTLVLHSGSNYVTHYVTVASQDRVELKNLRKSALLSGVNLTVYIYSVICVYICIDKNKS